MSESEKPTVSTGTSRQLLCCRRKSPTWKSTYVTTTIWNFFMYYIINQDWNKHQGWGSLKGKQMWSETQKSLALPALFLLLGNLCLLQTRDWINPELEIAVVGKEGKAPAVGKTPNGGRTKRKPHPLNEEVSNYIQPVQDHKEFVVDELK